MCVGAVSLIGPPGSLIQPANAKCIPAACFNGFIRDKTRLLKTRGLIGVIDHNCGMHGICMATEIIYGHGYAGRQ